MVRTLIKQSVVSLLCFLAVLLAFAQVDWMQVLGLHHSIIEEKLGCILGFVLADGRVHRAARGCGSGRFHAHLALPRQWY